MKDFYISKKYKNTDFLKLYIKDSSEIDWNIAIKILKERIEERFFEPIDLLIQYQENNTYGFTILAITCLLIETIQGFKDGIYNHKSKSKQIYKKFFNDIGYINKTDIFYNIRCGILHKGEVENYKIRSSGKLITDNYINRTELYNIVKKDFYKYIKNLENKELKELRENFLKVMNKICNSI